MNATYRPLWFFVIAVLLAGMFFPKLMDYDAAEYAGIAMHMEQHNSWGTIINRQYQTGLPYDYLDKPHVLFWSAWPGFTIFGITDYGYRFMSIVMSLLAALATMQLGTRLYNARVGAMAALMFISAQAIILANHDVRTDSLLTSFVVLAVWQVVSYLQSGRWHHLLWAGAFLAGGVGTKGMIAVLVSGCVVFFYLLGQKNWKQIFQWQWLLLVAAFFLFLSPVLYLYYLQFDLHPEKFTNGSYGNSGIKFILWTQSFERFAGDRAMVDNPEFSFFFHTLLWALLPWSLLCYAGVFSRLREGVQTRAASLFSREQLTFAGVWAMFIIMSMSSFKLPHYLNVLFPFMSIFTAGHLHQLFAEGESGRLRFYRGMQWVVIGILGILFVVLNGWAFPLRDWRILAAFLVLVAAALTYFRQYRHDVLDRVWIPSLVVILLLNFVLNTHFYPQIDKYQGGSAMAAEIKKANIPVEEIYHYHTIVRTFDFYTRSWRPMLSNEEIARRQAEGRKTLLFTNDEGLTKLKQQFQPEVLLAQPDFHITGLNGKFLNPATRSQSYGQVYLLKL